MRVVVNIISQNVCKYGQKINRGRWVDNKPPSGANKGTQGGLAISLSACADAEIAADTSVRN